MIVAITPEDIRKTVDGKTKEESVGP